MKNCLYYEELISRKLDDELCDQEMAELDSHLKDCKNCATFLTSLSNLKGVIQKDLPTYPFKNNNIQKDFKIVHHITFLQRSILFGVVTLFLLFGGGLGLSMHNANKLSKLSLTDLFNSSFVHDSIISSTYDEVFQKQNYLLGDAEEIEVQNETFYINTKVENYVTQTFLFDTSDY